jgi:predicted phosphodiesterase
MRTAIVSDIHGNIAALEAVVADAKARGCDAFANLGDILSGPLWPAETADYLMALGWPTISGNHERQLLAGNPERMIPSDAYAYSCLKACHFNWLRALPAQRKLGDDVLLCHGTPRSDVEYFLEHVDGGGVRAANAAEAAERAGPAHEAIILCGHTHIQRKVHLDDGRLVANPGSVGLPAYADDHPFPHVVEAGTPHARYAIVDGSEIELLAVDYDHEAAAIQAERNGRPDWAYALRNGRMN